MHIIVSIWLLMFVVCVAVLSSVMRYLVVNIELFFFSICGPVEVLGSPICSPNRAELNLDLLPIFGKVRWSKRLYRVMRVPIFGFIAPDDSFCKSFWLVFTWTILHPRLTFHKVTYGKRATRHHGLLFRSVYCCCIV